jgi:cytochrome c556
MRRHARLTATGLALGLGIFVLAASDTSGADDFDVKAAVQGLVNGKGDAKAIASKAELGEVMHLFKLRTKKGWGVGDKPGAITPDGIEAKIISLGKKELPKADLDKQAAALEELAKRTKAIGDVTDQFAPKSGTGEKSPKNWKKWVDEMKAGADDLAKAAKAKDAKGVKDAANKTNTACNECHSVFRD